MKKLGRVFILAAIVLTLLTLLAGRDYLAPQPEPTPTPTLTVWGQLQSTAVALTGNVISLGEQSDAADPVVQEYIRRELERAAVEKAAETSGSVVQLAFLACCICGFFPILLIGLFTYVQARKAIRFTQQKTGG